MSTLCRPVATSSDCGRDSGVSSPFESYGDVQDGFSEWEDRFDSINSERRWSL